MVGYPPITSLSVLPLPDALPPQNSLGGFVNPSGNAPAGFRFSISLPSNTPPDSFGAWLRLPYGPFPTHTSTFKLSVDGKLIASQDDLYRLPGLSDVYIARWLGLLRNRRRELCPGPARPLLGGDRDAGRERCDLGQATGVRRSIRNHRPVGQRRHESGLPLLNSALHDSPDLPERCLKRKFTAWLTVLYRNAIPTRTPLM